MIVSTHGFLFMLILLVSQLQYCPDGCRKRGVTIKWDGSVLPRRYQTSWQTAQLLVTWKADFTCPEALEMQSSERQWSSCPSLLKFLVIVERENVCVVQAKWSSDNLRSTFCKAWKGDCLKLWIILFASQWARTWPDCSTGHSTPVLF